MTGSEAIVKRLRDAADGRVIDPGAAQLVKLLRDAADEIVKLEALLDQLTPRLQGGMSL